MYEKKHSHEFVRLAFVNSLHEFYIHMQINMKFMLELNIRMIVWLVSVLFTNVLESKKIIWKNWKLDWYKNFSFRLNFVDYNLIFFNFFYK